MGVVRVFRDLADPHPQIAIAAKVSVGLRKERNLTHLFKFFK